MPSGRRSSVAEHWRLKPEALGLIPGGATFPFKPMLSKGLQAMQPQLCLGLDTISIGLRTTEESRPLDSSTAVITLKIPHDFDSFFIACSIQETLYGYYNAYELLSFCFQPEMSYTGTIYRLLNV